MLIFVHKPYKIVMIRLSYVILVVFALLFSCNNDDGIQIIIEPKLLSASSDGSVYEIGFNDGKIIKVGQINKEVSESIINTNSIVSSKEKIYAIEHVAKSEIINNLLVYDKKSKKTDRYKLYFSDEYSGGNKGVVALYFNGNSLIGILDEDISSYDKKKHIISINLDDYTVSDIGVSFNQTKITSLIQIDEKLYISTWGYGFLEVDLKNKTTDLIKFNDSEFYGTKMALINKDELAIMVIGSDSNSGLIPAKINVSTKTLFDKSSGESYDYHINIFGNSIYEDDVYINLVNNQNTGDLSEILINNYKTNKMSTVEILKNSYISSNQKLLEIIK